MMGRDFEKSKNLKTQLHLVQPYQSFNRQFFILRNQLTKQQIQFETHFGFERIKELMMDNLKNHLVIIHNQEIFQRDVPGDLVETPNMRIYYSPDFQNFKRFQILHRKEDIQNMLQRNYMISSSTVKKIQLKSIIKDLDKSYDGRILEPYKELIIFLDLYGQQNPEFLQLVEILKSAENISIINQQKRLATLTVMKKKYILLTYIDSLASVLQVMQRKNLNKICVAVFGIKTNAFLNRKQIGIVTKSPQEIIKFIQDGGIKIPGSADRYTLQKFKNTDEISTPTFKNILSTNSIGKLKISQIKNPEIEQTHHAESINQMPNQIQQLDQFHISRKKKPKVIKKQNLKQSRSKIKSEESSEQRDSFFDKNISSSPEKEEEQNIQKQFNNKEQNMKWVVKVGKNGEFDPYPLDEVDKEKGKDKIAMKTYQITEVPAKFSDVFSSNSKFASHFSDHPIIKQVSDEYPGSNHEQYAEDGQNKIKISPQQRVQENTPALHPLQIKNKDYISESNSNFEKNGKKLEEQYLQMKKQIKQSSIKTKKAFQSKADQTEGQNSSQPIIKEGFQLNSEIHILKAPQNQAEANPEKNTQQESQFKSQQKLKQIMRGNRITPSSQLILPHERIDHQQMRNYTQTKQYSPKKQQYYNEFSSYESKTTPQESEKYSYNAQSKRYSSRAHNYENPIVNEKRYENMPLNSQRYERYQSESKFSPNTFSSSQRQAQKKYSTLESKYNQNEWKTRQVRTPSVRRVLDSGAFNFDDYDRTVNENGIVIYRKKKSSIYNELEKKVRNEKITQNQQKTVNKQPFSSSEIEYSRCRKISQPTYPKVEYSARKRSDSENQKSYYQALKISPETYRSQRQYRKEYVSPEYRKMLDKNQFPSTTIQQQRTEEKIEQQYKYFSPSTQHRHYYSTPKSLADNYYYTSSHEDIGESGKRSELSKEASESQFRSQYRINEPSRLETREEIKSNEGQGNYYKVQKKEAKSKDGNYVMRSSREYRTSSHNPYEQVRQYREKRLQYEQIPSSNSIQNEIKLFERPKRNNRLYKSQKKYKKQFIVEQKAQSPQTQVRSKQKILFLDSLHKKDETDIFIRKQHGKNYQLRFFNQLNEINPSKEDILFLHPNGHYESKDLKVREWDCVYMLGWTRYVPSGVVRIEREDLQELL